MSAPGELAARAKPRFLDGSDRFRPACVGVGCRSPLPAEPIDPATYLLRLVDAHEAVEHIGQRVQCCPKIVVKCMRSRLVQAHVDRDGFLSR